MTENKRGNHLAKLDNSRKALSPLALPDALQGELDRLKRLLDGNSVRDVEARHDVGIIVEKVMADEATYGKDPVGKLALRLGTSSATLYRAADVARAFPRQELDALLKQRALPWSHLVELSKAKADERKTLVKRAVDEGLSVREIQIARKGAVASKAFGIQELIAALDGVAKKATALLGSDAFGLLVNDRDVRSPEQVKHLEEVLEATNSLMKVGSENTQIIKQALAAVQPVRPVQANTPSSQPPAGQTIGLAPFRRMVRTEPLPIPGYSGPASTAADA